MMMKKHFNAIALALNINKPGNFSPEKHKQWLDDIYAVSLACSSYSTRFDKVRFFTACGLGTDEITAMK